MFGFVGVASKAGNSVGVVIGADVNVGISVAVEMAVCRIGLQPIATQLPRRKQLMIPIKDFGIVMIVGNQLPNNYERSRAK
jgi:hypothetical protein